MADAGATLQSELIVHRTASLHVVWVDKGNYSCTCLCEYHRSSCFVLAFLNCTSKSKYACWLAVGRQTRSRPMLIL